MLTLAQLTHFLNGVQHGDADYAIFALSSLSRATAEDLAYFDDSLPVSLLESTHAGVVLLKEEHLSLRSGYSIVVSNPFLAMIKATELFSEAAPTASGIHPTAQVHPLARLGQQVSVGAYSVIDEQAFIADHSVIGADSFIGSFACIGERSNIGTGVFIAPQCVLGHEVYVDSGAIIGSAPFNYVKEHGAWQQGSVLGGVVIAHAVRIGANTVIARGSLNDTYIAEGVCIDNLVHIAHDVRIGKNTAIAACAAVGAHARIGADCIIGGASCIAAFATLADDVVISGMSTVSRSINKPGIYSSGTLAHDHQRWRRNAARFRRLDDYISKLASLEQKINRISDD